jgi:hypothetical protein
VIRHLQSIAILASLLIVTACDGAIISGTIHRAGAVDHFAASGGRDLKTVIIGNPFAQPKAQVDAAIIAAMQGHHSGPRTRFTATPGATAIQIYRIAILFDPPPTTDSAAVCRGSDRPAPVNDGTLRLLAAFCVDDLALTSVDAIVPNRVKSADDPLVSKLIANVMRELIPTEDPLAYID